MAITYRRGTLEDVELLIRLREQGVREMNNLDETADLSRLERENRRYYRQALADGSYQVDVALEGGSGRASVESPAQVTVRDGEVTATIVWSS